MLILIINVKYVRAKLAKTPFYLVEKIIIPLELIWHLWYDLKFMKNRGGTKWLCQIEVKKKDYFVFLLMIAQYTIVYLLRSKDEALKVFKYYKNEVEKVIRSDWGEECEAPFEEFCCIIQQIAAPYSPQSNEIIERKYWTLKQMMNTMLISSLDKLYS